MEKSKEEKALEISQYIYDQYAWGIKWDGRTCQKYPADLMVMAELIFEVQPDFIIESGTGDGGTALFFAAVLDRLGKGQIITIDTNPLLDLKHPRIQSLQGESISDEIFSRILERVYVTPEPKVIVDLDSRHDADYVFRELERYCQLVRSGCYIIVEDTNLAGPKEAVDKFLKANATFKVDKFRERFLATFNPGGYLKRD